MVGMEQMSNSNTVVSFTFDEICKDINYDRIFLFILSYEFDLNFNQIMTLFNFSSDIFWTYINTFRPILKIGDRKAAMIKHSARKVYFKWLGSDVELSDKEKDYYNYLSMFLNDSFSNGYNCLHCSKISNFPILAKGIFIEYKSGKQLQSVYINSIEELYKYIDSISTVEINGETYSKTSRVEYLIEKYYGDLSSREVRSKSIKNILSMMDKTAIEEHSKEIQSRSNALVKHRMELVNRNA